MAPAKRHSPSGSGPVLLLGFAALLTGVLGYEAWQAGRSNRVLARENLEDQAIFAAENFAREARHEVRNELLDEGLEVIGSATDRRRSGPLSMNQLEDAAEDHRWRAYADAKLFFRVDPDGQGAEIAGPGAERFGAWAVSRARRDASESRERLRLKSLFTDDGSHLLAYAEHYEGRGQRAVVGLVLPSSALEPAFAEAFEEERLLPGSITGGLGNDELFVATVRGPGGGLLYESGRAEDTEITAVQALDPALGGMALELQVRPRAMDQLVTGGLPGTRLPYVVALLSLTAGLLVAAVWQLRRELQLARLREDFVSSVSHQLRTPLAQIRMFGEMLAMGRVRSREEGARAAEIIVEESRRLAHQVDNLLVFSKGRRRGESLVLAETDLSALAHDVVEGFRPLALAEDARIQLAVEEGIVVEAHEPTMRQVLLNLLDNAVKYGPSPQVIRVGLSRVHDAEDEALLWIEDEGPGIPEEAREEVWSPYVRLERDRLSGTAGSGIGLAVVQEVIGAHGGTAEIRDASRGVGARLSIRLPLASRRNGLGSDDPHSVERP